MATCDPTQLIADGKCFSCLDGRQIEMAKLQLLCDLQAQITLLIATIPAPDTGPTAETLVYNATTILDFDGADYQTVTLAGNIDFASSINRAPAKSIVVRILADGSDRTMTFNANWTSIGVADATITANKVGILSLTSFGTTEADVVYAYLEEP